MGNAGRSTGIESLTLEDTAPGTPEDRADEGEMSKLYLKRAFQKRKDHQHDFEAFVLTTAILDSNSDFHVMWNFRREMILDWKENGYSDLKSLEAFNFRPLLEGVGDYELFTLLDSFQKALLKKKSSFDGFFSHELDFTTKLLTNHLKSYATWHHRTTIVKWMDNPPLEKELEACSECFSLDPRNFHCWNYRNFICELLFGPDEMTNRLNFFRKSIQRHPDNFSAYHYLSVLLYKSRKKGLLLGPDGSTDSPMCKIWDDEFSAILSSLSNLTYLQGLWLYFFWLCLMKSEFPIPDFSKSTPYPYRVLLDHENHILVYQFSQCLTKEPFDEVTLKTPKEVTSIFKIQEWYSVGEFTSNIWYHKVPSPCETISEVVFTFTGKTHIVPFNSIQSNLAISTINELPKSRFNLIRGANSTHWTTKITELSKQDRRQPIMDTNRYYNLTKAIMSEGNFETCLDGLIKIDPLRRNYYLDSKSRHTIENKLKANQDRLELNLQNLSLTCLHPVAQLTHLRSLDLSNNNLVRISSSFNSLISLKSLLLDNNRISMIDPQFKMVSLKRLSMGNNCLREKSSIAACNNCDRLELIILNDNVVISKYDEKNLGLDPRITIKT